MGQRRLARYADPRVLALAILLLPAWLGLPTGPASADVLAGIDPGPPLTYRVLWDGRQIEGIIKISGLARHTAVVPAREGGDPSSYRRSPGPSLYEPIVLERYLGADMEFEKWANKVWNFGSGLGAEVSLRDFRKDIRIVFYNEVGETVMAYRVYRCWPSDYQVLGEMAADKPTAPVETLVLQYEGWERDHEIPVPR